MEAATATRPASADDLTQEAGLSTGPMQNEKVPPAPVAPEPDEIRIDGTAQLEMFDVGGKKANTATLNLTGGKVKLIDGQAFHKGTRIKFSGEAIVNDVGQKDDEDPKTRQVVSAEQRHKARIVDLQVTSAS